MNIPRVTGGAGSCRPMAEPAVKSAVELTSEDFRCNHCLEMLAR